MSSKSLLFRPFPVLVCSLAGALLYAGWITWRFSSHGLANQYVYVVPIVVPFIAFLFDRVSEIREARYLAFVIDALVVGTAMMRVIGTVPFVSGHTLFLTYAIFRPGSSVTWIAAGVVMLEVIYLKFLVWHDPISALSGMMLGTLAALIVRSLNNAGRVDPESESLLEKRTV